MALIGTLGSLYFSEVMKFPPCSMCWYQRICLYPLVLILGTALVTEDNQHSKYSMPLILTGTALAIYHNLLYYDLIPKAIVPCTGELSCSTRQLEMFGFITIPLLSLGNFIVMSLISVLGYLDARRSILEVK